MTSRYKPVQEARVREALKNRVLRGASFAKAKKARPGSITLKSFTTVLLIGAGWGYTQYEISFNISTSAR